MVKSCSWGLCNSDSRYPERIEGVSFIRFPRPGKNLEKCRRWIKACGRPHDQLNIKTVQKNYMLFVCTKHFPEGSPTEKYPDPIPADSTRCTPKRPLPKKRALLEPAKKRRHVIAEISSNENETQVDESNHMVDEFVDENIQPPTQPEHKEESGFSVSPLEFLATVTENRVLKEKLAQQVLENEDVRRTIKEVKEQANDKKKETTAKPRFSVTTVNHCPIRDNFQYYTGFHYEQFVNIFTFLVPNQHIKPIQFRKTITSASKISLEDQLLLTLVKLRLNFEFKHIGYLFEISPQDAGAIFQAWINYMFHRFGSVSIWPDRQVIIDRMPPKFKEDFPSTMVIIDGTEIKMERPSALLNQSQCYSDYKSATTLKGLVGIDPRGSFTFISMLFSGAISDKKITNDSGFLDLLKQLLECGKLRNGDGIMVDKGFLIREEIENLGLKLLIPPFAPGSGQMSAPDVALTKKIATHRVHVERAISRAKKFKIVDHRLDLSLFPCVNQIWFCCCFLTGFMPLLINTST